MAAPASSSRARKMNNQAPSPTWRWPSVSISGPLMYLVRTSLTILGMRRRSWQAWEPQIKHTWA